MSLARQTPPVALLKDCYARMLLTRLVDEWTLKLSDQGRIGCVASSCGHEAAQVGSAICIEVGKDFTLPYYRDLGVVLTIGMTPYEIFRTYIQSKGEPLQHWGYHKHNMVTGASRVASHILHAAGIAFASKLRKAAVVTVAYCGDGAILESDFIEGISFAAQQQLPVVFLCEQDYTHSQPDTSSLPILPLPAGLSYHRVDGADVMAVYRVMQAAMWHARTGNGPVLLELCVHRPCPEYPFPPIGEDVLEGEQPCCDPLARCQQLLQTQHAWDETWANELYTRLSAEVARAAQDALREV